MTKDLVVEYDKKKCIGAKNCVSIAPRFFSFDGARAVLEGSRIIDGVYSLTVNSSPIQVEHFIKAGEACPVNAIKVIDKDKDTVLVSDEVNLDKKLRVIAANYDDRKDFETDPKGYFLIRVNQKKKQIEVGFCGELNKVSVTIIGKTPLELYQTIIKQGLITRLDHAAYLGRELQKAYISLQKGIPYVQDDELEL